MKKRFSKVIIAKHLFDGINEKDYEGYLCLSGNHIVEKKAGKPEKDILNQAQEVLNFRDELVMRELQILIHFLPDMQFIM